MRRETATGLDDRELALPEFAEQLVVLEARARRRERLIVCLERWECLERVPQRLQDLPGAEDGVDDGATKSGAD